MQPDLPVHQCRYREEAQQPKFDSFAPGHFPPHQRQHEDHRPWPSWFETLHSAFSQQAAVACEEEGPIAFVTTWFLANAAEQVTEESRMLRLDQFVQLWHQDIVDLWRDKIDLTIPISFEFVQPEPPRHDTSWTIAIFLFIKELCDLSRQCWSLFDSFPTLELEPTTLRQFCRHQHQQSLCVTAATSPEFVWIEDATSSLPR